MVEPVDERVDPIVLAFIATIEGGAAADVEAFVARQPDELRARVRERCLAYLEIQRVLTKVREPPRVDTSMSHELDDPMLGKQLGEYVLERRIGEGGMGIVYFARQARLDRPVAVKVLPAAYAAKRGRRERFEREARLPAKLDHPGIVKVFDAREEGDLRWYVMEYVAGRSLHDVLQELRRMPTPSPGGEPVGGRGWIPRAAQIACEVADALQHAHEHHVVHRDLKPQNILIDTGGAPRVVDFGLAIDLEARDGLTTEGEALGTPHYMSPEQARGDRARIDAHSDLYTLGVVLYEMLTLRRPFEGATREKVLADIASSPPRPVRRLNPHVPRDLETICLKALEKNPHHRYATAADFARDLRHFLNHEAIEAEPPPIWRRFAFTLRRRRGVVYGFLCGAALLALAAIWWREKERVAALPRITVRCLPEDRGVAVFLRSIDVFKGTLGPKLRIGELPIEDHSVEPGVWRVIVEKPGVGFAEMTRVVRGGLVEMFAWIRPTADVERDMKHVPGGKFRYGMETDPQRFFNQPARTEAEFFIDECEVTIAEWRDFLRACDRAGRHRSEPIPWQHGCDASMDELPVTSMSWIDAVEYAEWRGKRLPTSYEWEKAARGESGALYPWGSDPALYAEIHPEPEPSLPPLPTGQEYSAALWRSFVARLKPVRDCDSRERSPYGLRHVLSNVSEWTETVNVDLVEGIETPAWDERCAKGLNVDMVPRRLPVGLGSFLQLHANKEFNSVGFRCAKSAEP